MNKTSKRINNNKLTMEITPNIESHLLRLDVGFHS